MRLDAVSDSTLGVRCSRQSHLLRVIRTGATIRDNVGDNPQKSRGDAIVERYWIPCSRTRAKTRPDTTCDTTI